MKRNPIPEDVRQFILAHIPSVPYLEALLLLRRQPDSHWHAAQLARRLYQTEAAARTLLEALHARGVAAVVQGMYCYRPVREELAAAIERLAASYSGNLVAISKLIHASHTPAGTPRSLTAMRAGEAETEAETDMEVHLTRTGNAATTAHTGRSSR
ncbi:MAG TPA: hypothetical protein VIG66_02815 [Noviherbaspirillum sp.]